MANINEKEMMSKEELDNVAGGSRGECAADSRHLAKYGLMKQTWAGDFLGGDHDDELASAWSKVGIAIEIHTGNFFTGGKSNKYWLDGKQITQEEAWKHLDKVMGDK